MGSAPPPLLANSTEKENGAKLSRLLIDGGTSVLKNIFDWFHPPSKLAANLTAEKPTLRRLLEIKVLDKPKWDRLFPSHGEPCSDTFDISLLCCLLTNICGLRRPATGWDNKPPTSDSSTAAKTVHLRILRNEVFAHVTTTGIDTPRFLALWQEISGVLVSLGLDQAEIDKLWHERAGEEDYLKLLFEWVEREKDIKSILGKVLENTQEIKEGLENLQTVKENEKEADLLKNLVTFEFKEDINYHSDKFQAGTREWVFKEVEDWLNDRISQHRVMVISGNVGMGKTVISAKICKRMQDTEEKEEDTCRLAGTHFFQHGVDRYRNPQLMLQSLACHLCRALPEYKTALVEQLSRNVGCELNSMGLRDLFVLLFKEPLSTLLDPGRNISMVIDALDESESQGCSELLDVISNDFCLLPAWIRILVTTRPKRIIVDSLKKLNQLQLESSLDSNMEDIQLYFDESLHHVMRPEHKDAILEELVRMSEGQFLYAYVVVDHIVNNVSSLGLEYLESSLLSGISSVYLSYFKRLVSEVCKEVGRPNGKEEVLHLLSAVTFAREPLPLSFVSRVLSPDKRSVPDLRVVNKVIGCVSALLPIRNDRLHIFHKSVKDWLTDTSPHREDCFAADEKEGHQILSKLCEDELDEIKRRGVHSPEFSATERYALLHGVGHMVEVHKDSGPTTMEKLVANYVTDLELLYAKLCVNCAAGPDDILHVTKSEISKVLSKETRNTIERMSVLLKRNGSVLRDHPRTVFQYVLNKGGPQLSLKAAEVLDSKYPEIPYMKYLQQEHHHEAIKARMDCRSEVICFDVSSKKDYMVCECINGTIQLWSLHTCAQEWTCPMVVTKDYLERYRQSVVFHPKGDCVLPGILSNAYTIRGDWVPMFPTSCCSFSICAFSGDKTRLLTDCTDDPKHVAIWSLESGAEIQRIGLEEDIQSVAYSKDGDRVAISDSTGYISLFDVQYSSAHLLGKVMDKECEIMHFSPNSKTLLGRVGSLDCASFDISVREICDFSGVGQPDEWKCLFWPLDFDSLNKYGFLRKNHSNKWFEDPPFKNHRFLYPSGGYFSMINEDTALFTSQFDKHVTMLSVEDKMVDFERFLATPSDVVFSLDGANVYEITKTLSDRSKVTVAVLDVSSRKVKEQNSFTTTSSFFPVIPVKGGVLLLLENQSPELWNEDVTHCVRSFSQLSNIETAVPVSEEVVACGRSCSDFGFKVDVLNTSSGEILSSSIIPVSCDVRLLGCNSQYQCFICTIPNESPMLKVENPVRVSCWDKTSKLWENLIITEPNFAFRDDFVVMWDKGVFHYGVHVFDARTGAPLHTLLKISYINDCKFLSDGEFLVCCSDFIFVWLFNVRSGELLSVLEDGCHLSYVSACRQKPLIAVDPNLPGFTLIRVHLPRLEDSEKKQDRNRKRLMEEDENSIKGKLKKIEEDPINVEPATGAQAKDCPPKLSFTLPRLSDLEPSSKPCEEVKLPIDALLLTVNDCEFVSCYVHLKDRFRSYFHGLGNVYFGTMGEGQVTVALLKGCSASPGGSLIVVKNAADVLRPKVVISVGTCGSLRPEEAKLGDVVLAAKLTTYACKEFRNDRVVSRGVRTLCSRDTGNLIKHAAFGWKAPLENPKAREITVHSDSEVLSGPELVNCGWRKEELIEQHPTATAIEMEGEGVFSAAYDLKMEWLVVKGISNHADGTETETAPWKTFGSAMAASVVYNMLKDPVVLRDWPHYKR